MRANKLFSAAMGMAPSMGSSSKSKAQPIENVRLYRIQEMLDCFFTKVVAQVDGDIVQCYPYECRFSKWQTSSMGTT